MGNYSNVMLPQRSGYDQEAYPYAAGVFCYQHGTQDWFAFELYYSDAPFVYHGALDCVTNSGNCCKQVFRAADGVWTAAQVMGGAPVLCHGRSQTVFRRIWTEQQILDGADVVWLEAGQVTDGGWAGLGSWNAGFATGLSWLPFRCAQTEVAEKIPMYRYNNTILPAYPPELTSFSSQVVICKLVGKNSWQAWAGSAICYDTSSKYLRNTSSSYINYRTVHCDENGWGAVWVDQIPNNWPFTTTTGDKLEPVWASFDLYARDGSLYLKGSSPVMVLEKHGENWGRYDPTLWLLGWQLGRRLAGGRNGEGTA